MNQELPRTITRRDAYMLIVGNIIGIGIFTTTGYISQNVSTPGVMLLVWLLGGIFAFCGGMTYAELSTRFPRAGGDFQYLSYAYHPLAGFLFGWAAFVVTYTGSVATIAVGFSHYFLNLFSGPVKDFQFPIPLLSLNISSLKLLSIFIAFVFTYLNVRGIRSGALWQNIFTLVGITVLLAFIIFGFSSQSGDWRNLQPFLPDKYSLTALSGIGVALIGIYFTYSGWTAIAYIAGEVRHPRRTIPYAMWTGVATVTVLYVVVNIVFLYALPLNRMRDIVDIGYETLLVLRGREWSAFFTVMIMIAVLSTLNATILSGARIYYAMSRRGDFFSWAGRLHPTHRSPGNALWLQFGWTALLILTGTFKQLLTYTVFIMICFAFLSGIGLFFLRKRGRANKLVYPAWGFPVTPGVFVIISLWIMVNTLWEHPMESLLGILLVLLGIPFYFYFNRSRVG